MVSVGNTPPEFEPFVEISYINIKLFVMISMISQIYLSLKRRHFSYFISSGVFRIL